jgi:DNA-binding XRE family transcriptional regulator
MCGTSANKSYLQTIIRPLTAREFSRRSMIITERSKLQQSWVLCQTICSILRQESLPLTKTCSRLVKSQRCNKTLNRLEFSLESVVTPVWSQITHETWTKGTSTLKTDSPQSSSMITFQCSDSNDSTSARSPHKVWWCRTLRSAYKTQAVTSIAITPSVKLHLRKLHKIIINHLGQTIKMSRCFQSTISPNRMGLHLEVKTSNTFLMRRGPELAVRTRVINRRPTSARRSRVSVGRRMRVRRDQA